MLVLTRRVGETIVISTPAGPITITVSRSNAGPWLNVALGIDAPEQYRILRGELEAVADDE